MPGSEARVDAEDEALVHRFSGEHQTLRPDLDRLRAAADAARRRSRRTGRWPQVREVHEFLVEDLLPHEEAEDAILYPVLAKVLGGTDPTGTMSRAHVEIAHRSTASDASSTRSIPPSPDADDLIELRRVLYGLHAILELHFAQEDEGYLSLVDSPDGH